MKLSIAKDQLIAGLQAVQNVVSSRTTLPVLSNVLLSGEGDRLRFTATDLDVTVSCSVEAKIGKSGGTTIPVKRFFSIVRELQAPEVELDTNEKSVSSLKAGASFYKINGIAADEFPPTPEFKESAAVTLPQEKVKAMLKKTSIAISMDESRYVLNGVYVSFKSDKVTMVATDGRRLAMTEEELDGDNTATGEIIIPTKAVTELNRLLQNTGNVIIRFTENQISFTLDGEGQHGIVLISKLVEGNYPNYKQVIPNETKERVTLVREELLQALRRAEIMTNDKSNSVKMAFTKNNLAITANTPEVGEGRESIAINYNGPDISIAFNPGYLMDPLKVLESDEIFIELNDELSPGIVRVNGPFLYVLMPMRMS
ncbi:MAG: DNA polymerase III subunit beta [Verrucomicrobiae bacterium]|jgi:DNA polymerase-3 subunit beta|nr:DNA polymerase III subunit beta [Verrucomicrobiae bacterium]